MKGSVVVSLKAEGLNQDENVNLLANTDKND